MIFKKTQLVFLLFIFLSSFVRLNAQEKKTENLCLIFKQHKISVPQNQILVMGEVFAAQFLRAMDDGQTLLESIARVGGIPRDIKVKNVQILKCSQDFEKIEKNIFVDLRNVFKKKEKDVSIEGGEIIIVRKNRKSELPKEYFEKIITLSMMNNNPQILSPSITIKILY